MTDPYAAAASEVLARTIEICEIPAPPLQESARATCVEQWWKADGIDEVSQDEIGNVWGRLRDGHGPAVLVAAHLDTVFATDIVHGARPDGAGGCSAPASATTASRWPRSAACAPCCPTSCDAPVWVVATVGEEGLGNLAGVTAALREPRAEVGALIALEGNYLGRVNTVGVGSVRVRVAIDTPGGHAWEDADAPSAVHVAAAHDRRARPGARRDRGPAPRSTPARLAAASPSTPGRCAASSTSTCARTIPAAGPAQRRRSTPSSRRCPPAYARGDDRLGRRPAGRIEDDHPLVRAGEQALREVGVPRVVRRRAPTRTPRTPRRSPRSPSASPSGTEPYRGRVDRDRAARTGLRAGVPPRPAVEGRGMDEPNGSGVALQGVDPPAAFVDMVAEIESLGFGHLWLTDSSLHARNS